jgi:hypothetical protein
MISKLIGKKLRPKRKKPPPKRKHTPQRGMVKESKKILDKAKKNKKIGRQDYNKLKDMADKARALDTEKKAKHLLKKGSFRKVRKEVPLPANENIKKKRLRVVSPKPKNKRKKGGRVMSGQDLVNSCYD